ncbi:MAG: hypothetical protein HY842_04035 [Bacteroidetes bacterium]|nr:hypothetical protein [Bacteroidota bacterium]
MKTLSPLLVICVLSAALFSQSKPEILENPASSVPVHFQGMVTKPNGQPVGDVTLIVLPYNYAILNNPSGSFDFTLDLQDNVTYQLLVEKDYDPLNGPSTFELDLIKKRILKHILGILPFTSPYQIIAADLDGNGIVTIFDVTLLRKHFLGLDFPDNFKSWRFAKAGCDPIADPTNCPLDYVETFTTDSEMMGLQIIGIQISDVSN